MEPPAVPAAVVRLCTWKGTGGDSEYCPRTTPCRASQQIYDLCLACENTAAEMNKHAYRLESSNSLKYANYQIRIWKL